MTVREGLWKSEVFAALSKGTGVPVAEYTAAAKDAAAIGLPAAPRATSRATSTPRPTSSRSRRPRPSSSRSWWPRPSTSWTRRASARRDYQKTLIVASIVEGEAGVADRGKVARVVENRLENPTGPTVGLLQMDSTVNFALQKRGNLTKAEYDSAKSEPLRHLRAQGSPAGPDQQPRCEAAIEAAANPTEGPVVLLRHGQLRHRRDPVRDHPGRARPQQRPAPDLVRREQAEVRGRWLTRAGRRSSGLRWRTRCRRCCTRRATARWG